MDSYFSEYLYRTRLYAPLVMMVGAYLIVPQFRKGLEQAGRWIDEQKTWKAALLCAAVSFGLGLGLIYEGKSWGGDYSQYFAQARAIATGTISEWNEANQFIVDHSFVGLSPGVYPWFWPLLLVPVYLIFQDFPIFFLKVYSAVLAAIGIYAFVHLLHRRMRLSRAVVVATLVLWNYSLLVNVNALDSDLIGFSVSMVALNFVDLYLRDGSGHPIRHAILSGLLMYASVMTRLQLLCLLLALIAYDVVLVIRRFVQLRCPEGRIRRLADAVTVPWTHSLWVRVVPYAVYGAASLTADYFLPGSVGSNSSFFTFTFGKFISGLTLVYSYLEGFFGSGVGPVISTIIAVCAGVTAVLSVIGVIVSLKKELYLAFFLGGSILVLSLFNYGRIQYAYTIYPLILLFAEEGISWLKDRMSMLRKYLNAALIAAMILTLAQTSAGIYSTQVKGYNLNESRTEDALALYDFIKENVSDDSVVYFFKPRVLYLETNVLAYCSDNNDPEDLNIADYVLLSEYHEEPNITAAVQDSEEYELIYENARFSLYEKRK